MTDPAMQPPSQPTLDIGDDAGIEKVDGRSRAARAARLGQNNDDAQAVAPSQRSRPRRSLRQPARDPVRSPARTGAVIEGRDGEMLSRTVPDDKGDTFHVPAELIPPGWSYQWNTVSVIGNSEVALKHMNRMYANGWRPVPADRHPGRWTAINHKGDIVVEGLRLEERPLALTEEAADHDQRKAMRQVSDRDEALMGGKAKVRNMPQGFVMNDRYRGTGGDLRMSIDGGLDIPVPQHTLAEPGE